MKFPEQSDRAYIAVLHGTLQTKHSIYADDEIKQTLRGTANVYFTGANCTGDAWMYAGTAGEAVPQREYFIHHVGQGLDQQAYIPDPNAQLEDSGSYFYMGTSWDVANQRCDSGGGHTNKGMIPAIPVEMNYKFPMRIVFR